jgi:hypothetical protein
MTNAAFCDFSDAVLQVHVRPKYFSWPSSVTSSHGRFGTHTKLKLYNVKTIQKLIDEFFKHYSKD